MCALVTKYRKKVRDVPGPTPGSWGIRARAPNKRPPDWLILENRERREKLKEEELRMRHMMKADVESEWKRTADKKMQVISAKRQVADYMKANEGMIDERRRRLRQMLQDEEIQLLAEMEDKEETTIERQAKMRERAKFLKDRRETERLKVVQEKLDQQFRNQCEELRSTISKRHQDQVCAERIDQLRLKGNIDAEEAALEQMYAQMWEEDRLKKEAKEEADVKAQYERNQAVLAVLQTQMAALATKKAEERSLRDEEAQLLREQAVLRKLEERQARAAKWEKQKDTRDMLDLSLKIKMKKRAREEQEELAFDLKILEQLLEETRNEAMEQTQRKRELKEEDARYRSYLAKLIAEEQEKEVALEKLIGEEVEKTWQKRLDQWAREREARRKLLQEVMRVRAEQIQERLTQNTLEQREAIKERQELLIKIEENKRLEVEEKEQIHRKNMQYQDDLTGQIGHNVMLREVSANSEREQNMLGAQAELEYQAKLRKHLLDVREEKMHPFRRHIMNQLAQYQ